MEVTKNNMHILFTRPLEDSKELILKFRDLGHKVSHMPVIQIEKVEYEKINFLDYKAIIFTSANALKFLDTKLIDKKIICFCVGSLTEKKARSLGFQNVITAEGNVRTLKELILQNFNSSDGKMLYVSGEIISNDLDKNLISIGYNIKRVINYTSKPNYKLDETFIEKLRINMPDIVSYHSQQLSKEATGFGTLSGYIGDILRCLKKALTKVDEIDVDTYKWQDSAQYMFNNDWGLSPAELAAEFVEMRTEPLDQVDVNYLISAVETLFNRRDIQQNILKGKSEGKGNVASEGQKTLQRMQLALHATTYQAAHGFPYLLIINTVKHLDAISLKFIGTNVGDIFLSVHEQLEKYPRLVAGSAGVDSRNKGMGITLT